MIPLQNDWQPTNLMSIPRNFPPCCTSHNHLEEMLSPTHTKKTDTLKRQWFFMPQEPLDKSRGKQGSAQSTGCLFCLSVSSVSPTLIFIIFLAWNPCLKLPFALSVKEVVAGHLPRGFLSVCFLNQAIYDMIHWVNFSLSFWLNGTLETVYTNKLISQKGIRSKIPDLTEKTGLFLNQAMRTHSMNTNFSRSTDHFSTFTYILFPNTAYLALKEQIPRYSTGSKDCSSGLVST